MDMADEQVREWWREALRDLERASAMLELGWFDTACFHAQQAVEKALKAVLRASGAIVRTHDLVSLMEMAEDRGLDTGGIDMDDVDVLSNQYMAPRYPNFREELSRRGVHYEYTREFGELCVQVARDVLRRVERWLAERGLIRP